jgi:hypothetical protein
VRAYADMNASEEERHEKVARKEAGGRESLRHGAFRELMKDERSCRSWNGETAAAGRQRGRHLKSSPA